MPQLIEFHAVILTDTAKSYRSGNRAFDGTPFRIASYEFEVAEAVKGFLLLTIRRNQRYA
jgi:hypothetical protein